VAASCLEPTQFPAAGDLEPFCRCFVRLYLGHERSFLPGTAISTRSFSSISALPSHPFQLTPALATFRLAKRQSPFLAVGHEKTCLLYITQHPFPLYLLAEAFEQLLL
jgi:hypothetical protein